MNQIQPGRPATPTPTVDARRLWAGGAATALVAALAAVVGLLIVRGLLDIPVITPATTVGNPQASTLAVGAAVAALIGSAAIYFTVGIAIVSLLSGVAGSAQTSRPETW
ncbi:hypothetical protein [Rhodococcus opacus]|uniref:hypothetical protein n=1 Tax=Rhodococcus opacus TaxID=37919 RepID=UPI00155B0F9F|nr:hypothetical protein [Rhodococcus opacus]